MPVAQPLTVCAPASSSTVWSAPLVKLGASLTALTVMTKLCVGLESTPPLAVPPLSFATSVLVAVPLAFAAEVYESVPADETAGPAENRLWFVLFVTTNDTVWPDSFGPALIAVAQFGTLCAPASSFTVWSAPFVKLGASFTPVTWIWNVCAGLVSLPPLAVPPSSFATSVIVAEPNAFGAGV